MADDLRSDEISDEIAMSDEKHPKVLDEVPVVPGKEVSSKRQSLSDIVSSGRSNPLDSGS